MQTIVQPRVLSHEDHLIRNVIRYSGAHCVVNNIKCLMIGVSRDFWLW